MKEKQRKLPGRNRNEAEAVLVPLFRAAEGGASKRKEQAEEQADALRSSSGPGHSSSGSGADRKPVAAGTENLWKLYVACAGKGRYCTGSPV